MRMLAASVALSLLAATPTALADDLVILSAAAVRPALIQLPAMFEKDTGHKLTVSFGNATDILNRVKGGAKVDIVILPPRQLKALIGTDHLVGQTRFDLGVVRLGLAARAGSAAASLPPPSNLKAVLLDAHSFGMPDPALGSTSSAFMVSLFGKLGIADAMKPKLRLFKDGTEALKAIAAGEVALTIAPVTSIRVVPGVALLGPLPEAMQDKTIYAAALSRQSAGSGAAKALLAKLRSPEFAAVMRDRGIDPP